MSSFMDQVLQDNKKTPRQFLAIRLAQDAGLLGDSLEMAAFDRLKQRQAWEYTKSVMHFPESAAAVAEDESMATVTIGDTYNVIGQQPAQQTAAPVQAPAPTIIPITPTPASTGAVAPTPIPLPTSAASGLGTAAKVALAGAALVAAGGLGASGPVIYNAIKTAPAVIPAVAPVDPGAVQGTELHFE